MSHVPQHLHSRRLEEPGESKTHPGRCPRRKEIMYRRWRVWQWDLLQVEVKGWWRERILQPEWSQHSSRDVVSASWGPAPVDWFWRWRSSGRVAWLWRGCGCSREVAGVDIPMPVRAIAVALIVVLIAAVASWRGGRAFGGQRGSGPQDNGKDLAIRNMQVSLSTAPAPSLHHN